MRVRKFWVSFRVHLFAAALLAIAQTSSKQDCKTGQQASRVQSNTIISFILQSTTGRSDTAMLAEGYIV
jgi:hypothetical protein